MADPLQDVPLETILSELVDAYGFEGLAARIPIPCFQNAPTIPSSLELLERTPSARAQVERFYMLHLRERERRARRPHGGDLRAAAGLAVDATKRVVDVVEDMHTTIGADPIITPLVYKTVRGVTGLVGERIDMLLARLGSLLGRSAPGPQREALLAAVNGVIGDHLEASKSPLAILMSLRFPLEPRQRDGTLLVLVHGSSMCDLSWTRRGHDHGCALAHELGFTPAYVHYNSGRHVSANGKELAELLARESGPFADIVILAHSLGGLVARAAIHAAEEAEHAWRRKLRALVTLGTPHHGAPLERAGNLFETFLGATRYSAPLRPLGRLRSAGVTDMRFGNVVEADWRERDRFAHGSDPRTPTPLPEGVRCYAVAATAAPTLERRVLPSDGLVPVASALGEHEDDAFTLRFTDKRVVPGLRHLDLLSSRQVYELLREWLDPARAASSSAPTSA